MSDSKEDKQLKETEKKIKETIGDIEKRMEQLLQDEKDKLLAEVNEAVNKTKAMMPNSDNEE